MALGSSPPQAPGSPSQTRQRHRKAVAIPCPPVSRPTESSRSSTPVMTARHPADVKSPYTEPPAPPRLISPQFPPLRLVRRLPDEFIADTWPRQASDNPSQLRTLRATLSFVRIRGQSRPQFRAAELPILETCAFNMVQLRCRPIFLDSFTNQIFGFPFTPAPFMTSFNRGDAAKISARFRVLKS